MRRRLRSDEARLWRTVASSVERLPGRELPAEPDTESPAPPRGKPVKAAAPPPKPATMAATAPGPLHYIEPNRERRITIGREAIGARLDLHGLSQDRARAALETFIRRAHAEGQRAVLVITGRGRLGESILRRRVPDWLSEPPLRALVAGVSTAHRRHGGEGAIYVALKRQT